MTVCIVEMPSYTYAVKGSKLLNSRGYHCKIKRDPNTSADSCGYSIYVYNFSRAVTELLDRYSVPYTRVTCGGDVYDDKLR
ncbi:MAG: DUF3343 domain-containing protein [Ruminococcus sp.]|nr:DUF3343 domain-containing protein [Ruminococcus sp.]